MTVDHGDPCELIEDHAEDDRHDHSTECSRGVAHTENRGGVASSEVRADTPGGRLTPVTEKLGRHQAKRRGEAGFLPDHEQEHDASDNFSHEPDDATPPSPAPGPSDEFIIEPSTGNAP